MSKTIRMANGDLYISPNTGASEEIDGSQKASQDVADIMLTPLKPTTENRSYVAFRKFNPYGFEMANIQVPYLYSGVLGKGIVTKKVAEAVDRLKSMQNDDPYSTIDERIDKTQDIQVAALSATDFYYLLVLQLETTDEIRSSIIPVALAHQIPKSGFGILQS